MDKKYLYQFIPKRFEYLKDSKKIEYKDKILKTDYIINLINEFIIKFLFSSDSIDSIFINLWSVILRKKYGMNYNYYINYLIDMKFIFLVSDYCVSKKSRTYKINNFDVSKLKRIKVYDNILLKKHSRVYMERNFTEINNSPIPLDIRKRLVNDIYHTSIDFDKSIEYLNNQKKNGLIENSKYYKNILSVNSIKNNQYFFKFDSYGRFHSNFTVLKKQIRNNFLKIDGDDVCEIDIKNSQPFFLSILMKKYMADWDEFDDVEKYFFVVNNGIIYDDILERYDIFKTRDDAKKMIYKVFFGKNGDFKKYSKIFELLYPNVYKFIKNYKENMGDYKSISHELQKIESDFIFNNVINDIKPSVRIVTIHDSIIFPCKYNKYVSDIFYSKMSDLKNK
jgi:hypothetical protein